MTDRLPCLGCEDQLRAPLTGIERRSRTRTVSTEQVNDEARQPLRAGLLQDKLDRCIRDQAAVAEKASLYFERWEIADKPAAGDQMFGLNPLACGIEHNRIAGLDVGREKAEPYRATVQHGEVDVFSHELPQGREVVDSACLRGRQKKVRLPEQPRLHCAREVMPAPYWSLLRYKCRKQLRPCKGGL